MKHADLHTTLEEFIALAERMAEFRLRTKVVTVWGDPVVIVGPPTVDEAASMRARRLSLTVGTMDDALLPPPDRWATLLGILKDTKAALKLTEGFPPGFAEKMQMDRDEKEQR